jgi:hypothetical protein
MEHQTSMCRSATTSVTDACMRRCAFWFHLMTALMGAFAIEEDTEAQSASSSQASPRTDAHVRTGCDNLLPSNEDKRSLPLCPVGLPVW